MMALPKLRVVYADDRVEEDEPHNRPGDHEDVGLDRVVQKQVREDLDDCEDAEDRQAYATDDALCARTLLARGLEDRDRGDAVEDGGTDCGGVHDPAD